MKKFIVILSLWFLFVVLDIICLTILRKYNEADNELTFGYTYIEVPLSLIGCLLLISHPLKTCFSSDKGINDLPGQ
jgi:hypothetical protein